jgi:bifunctional DNase/RNase
MYHEVTIQGFTMDGVSRRPVVILKGTDGTTTVPLWISMAEGVSIAADLISRDLLNQGKKQDFHGALLNSLGMRIERVTIDRDDGGNILASVCLAGEDREMSVAVAVTEALNIALTRKVPLMVSADVADWAVRYAENDKDVLGESNERRYADFLENLDASQLNKLPM